VRELLLNKVATSLCMYVLSFLFFELFFWWVGGEVEGERRVVI
jgi:hypothetical protein